ncbi:MAG: HEAT repeat domain-containing protein, partial [Planctomycetota bacterium]
AESWSSSPDSVPPLREGKQEDGDKEEQRKHEERVQKALADLKSALREKEPRLRAAGVDRWKTLDDERVAKALRPALEDKTPEVRDAAISALRWMKNDGALEELHRFFKRAKKLRKDSEAFALLLRAIGQHADASSIARLTDALQADPDKAVMRARVYGLAKIRTVESIEAIFQILKSIDKDKVQKYMGEMRIALMLLTKEDFGVAQQEWRSWWKDARRGFEIAEKIPRLPKRELAHWNRFWGNEQE